MLEALCLTQLAVPWINTQGPVRSTEIHVCTVRCHVGTGCMISFHIGTTALHNLPRGQCGVCDGVRDGEQHGRILSVLAADTQGGQFTLTTFKQYVLTAPDCLSAHHHLLSLH